MSWGRVSVSMLVGLCQATEGRGRNAEPASEDGEIDHAQSQPAEAGHSGFQAQIQPHIGTYQGANQREQKVGQNGEPAAPPGTQVEVSNHAEIDENEADERSEIQQFDGELKPDRYGTDERDGSHKIDASRRRRIARIDVG